MNKRIFKPAQSRRPRHAESSSQKLPIDLEALTPQQRIRLDKAVMTLVEYLVSTSAQTG